MPLDPIANVSFTIEVAFPLRGDRLPSNHQEALYRALCALPDIGAWFAESNAIAIGPVAGQREADGRFALTPASQLRLRLPADELPLALGLSERRFDAEGARIDLGEPRVRPVQEATRLRAGLVILGDLTPDDVAGPNLDDRFLAGLQGELAELEIQAEVLLGPPGSLLLGHRTLHGFAVSVSCPDADDSIHLQEAGLGDYRKLGCGVFVPE